jgi:integrase/recombinase XerD
LYGAGLRLGEALALNISDLDLEQSLLRVRQSKFYKYAAARAMHD